MPSTDVIIIVVCAFRSLLNQLNSATAAQIAVIDHRDMNSIYGLNFI